MTMVVELFLTNTTVVIPNRSAVARVKVGFT